MGLNRNTVCILAALLLVVVMVYGGTNCGVGPVACDKCGANSKTLKVGDGYLKVCCGQTCSKYFTAGYIDETNKLGPICTCLTERVRGNCLKGEECNSCTSSVGSINGLPICCPGCSSRGMSLRSNSTGTFCTCY